MIGRVVSTKMKNTAVVLVERTAKHPLYKKTFIRTKKYPVEADGSIKDGDIVEIMKIKPISKNKHWKVVKVIGADLAAINKEQLKVAAEEAIAEVMPEEDKGEGESGKGEEVKTENIKTIEASKRKSGKERKQP
ncbi:30S ribosomal protein S17 [Candidatus Daviesbacteria bacterium RIFCSPLOWO2_02_FULL_41_8]|uniref:30S ribosomal protein S17 n=3 Tax=Candidatus Daviesiibacteriota TaxID=1752718 RepID=A0A1F5NLT2_9BACT|nr:MAG: 30S ribosomal protein S17 [Candidatus Daviesbacteria bacterium RIFCSPHIGHO2_01_FULL_41_23]OGE32792.1 MAG: 30S ribosomal protein S17 [Candidatus Daviesbacteria bacterium RIFCSPHIGHO2_02_FULL_41_10]OGE62134.1 MAG: 30S ribosomal protein S17 [Candidatus Daviesbacteria bacterium RIFCSPLOWO2_01_FULL_41_32]OGE78615.1 MAG: 30S ribosomal protein S17 [Candidatus Daviesbacteria bacterium RIFCSPLOWO2_02_FULL_41_8]